MTTNKLVNAETLLKELFDEDSRPTDRWLRYQCQRRTIPFVKLGRIIRFDIAAVRQALETKFTIQPRRAA